MVLGILIYIVLCFAIIKIDGDNFGTSKSRLNTVLYILVLPYVLFLLLIVGIYLSMEDWLLKIEVAFKSKFK